VYQNPPCTAKQTERAFVAKQTGADCQQSCWLRTSAGKHHHWGFRKLNIFKLTESLGVNTIIVGLTCQFNKRQTINLKFQNEPML
jgi:hypothetical protein